ncbi:MAG TPA: TatD family hydrolase, partial [Pontiella sp.]|nr:TatD family hydrolase [Pontiella sp.]
MKLYDCHNHVQDERLFPMIDDVMERARDAGVIRMGVKGCCEDDWQRVINVMENHEGIHPAFGLHPWFIADRSPRWLETMETLLLHYPKASVGEIGIDHAVEERNDEDQESV